MSSDDKSIAMIEQDMARSRAEIDRSTAALKAKMEPENLAETARQVIVESTQRVEERVRELADGAGDQVESLGERVVEYIQANPLPTLLAGVGLGLLISMAERESYVATPRGPEPSRLNQTLAQHPKLMRAQRATMRRARRVNRQHPLLVGAAVLGAGFLLGSLLPNTRREHELMGPTRDRLLESGKETAQQALTQVKSAVELELEKGKVEASQMAKSAEEAALAAFHEARAQAEEDVRVEPVVP